MRIRPAGIGIGIGIGVGVVLAAMLLAGCSAAPDVPRATVTVTVTASPTPTPLRAAEAAPWDLHAVCAAESGVLTLQQWHDDQVRARRLTTAQAEAVVQGIAVEYLNMNEFGVPAAVQQPVAALAGASGTLARPRIDVDATAVRRAQTALSQTCQDAGLTIGVSAQGG